MKRLFSIFLSFYFFFGVSFLPYGDFSTIEKLPECYAHCKATEDNDMTPVDFITDHLINVDCLFDKHDNGDHQKPHQPFEYSHSLYVAIGLPPIRVSIDIPERFEIFVRSDQSFYEFQFISSPFHPPSV